MNAATPHPPAAFDRAFYRGRRVLVTGHTGFKGSWLCQWLLHLGAEVTGCALPPEDRPNLFEVLGLQDRMDHRELDITDRDELAELVEEVRPEVVFHLAAQSLVLRSFDDPLQTLETNVLGTAHLLAALAAAGYDHEFPCAVVCVTSDKCYAPATSPPGSNDAHREGDPMGGDDLYSASKGMVELLCQSWRRSFFAAGGGPAPVRLATARAGNVIGGGDWARDRIVPDAIRALRGGRPIAVRHPDAIRPWQHVLEPLGGYLDLAQALHTRGAAFESGWNFGPGADGERSVATLCNQLIGAWGGGGWQAADPPARRAEAACLRLDIDKARTLLGWQPTWSFEHGVRQTVAWYRRGLACRHDPAAMIAQTVAQIEAFERDRVAVPSAPPDPAPALA